MTIAQQLFAAGEGVWEDASEIALVELKYKLDDGAEGAVCVFTDHSGAIYFDNSVVLFDECDVFVTLRTINGLLNSVAESRN